MQKGWIYNNERWTHDELMAYARTYPVYDDGTPAFPYPPEVLALMFQGQERTFMSPTTIQGCARQGVLQRQADFYVPLHHAWAATQGTAMHAALETAQTGEDDIREKRLVIQVELTDGRWVEIQGKPDKLVRLPDGNWKLIDYKTIKKPVGNDRDGKPKPKPGWVSQLSVYALMARLHGFNVVEATIYQIPREGVAENFVIPVVIPLWDDATTQDYLIQRATEWAGVFDGTYDLDHLPPPLDFTTSDMSWLCTSGWCHVADLCRQKAAEGK